MDTLIYHSVVKFDTRVRDASFQHCLLHFVWGGPNFGIWKYDNIGAINPFFANKKFIASKINWVKNGTSMVLKSGTDLCIYYPNFSMLKESKPKRQPYQPIIEPVYKSPIKTGHTYGRENVPRENRWEEKRDRNLNSKNQNEKGQSNKKDNIPDNRSNRKNFEVNKLLENYDQRNATDEKIRISGMKLAKANKPSELNTEDNSTVRRNLVAESETYNTSENQNIYTNTTFGDSVIGKHGSIN